ncbi:MAG TPA: hypothetical protein VJC18_06800, partial [bacterium]|nr:hypothetical protein [bacterium]
MSQDKSTEVPQETGSAPPKKVRCRVRRRVPFFQYRTFWFLLFVLLGIVFTAMLNRAMNDREYQDKFANYLWEKSQIRLKFYDIKFNLFTGKVGGSELSVYAQKNRTLLSLSEFTLKYNPFYLWIGRFKITGVRAREFFLDTSQAVKAKSKNKKFDPKMIPFFLKHVHLKQAAINKFDWLQPRGGHVLMDDIQLTSKFGSGLHTSPLQLRVNGLEYRGHKQHAFVKRLALDGFFLFDFSQPLIFDQSRISAQVSLTDALFGFYRRPKPWLTDAVFAKDLEPLIRQYYREIPD